MPGADHLNFTKLEKPGLWEPKAALTFFELCNKIDVHLKPGPMTRETILVICFHETGFSNIKQGRGSGPAVGFGQMEIFNLDKIPFFEWLGLDSVTNNPNLSPTSRKDKKFESIRKLPTLTPERVMADHDFAVKMHCHYFHWLNTEAGVNSIDGMLRAQTGGGKNAQFVEIFRKGGQKLKEVIHSGDRKKVVDALNSVMFHFPKDSSTLEKQSVGLDRFKKYWDYAMPESEMILGFRK